MHPDISFFPSKTFYYAKLQDSEEVVNRLDPECLKFLKKKRNVFIDVDNSEEKMDPYSKSFYNRGELKVVI
jgi:superfamily I DNA and/or RNA helicase